MEKITMTEHIISESSCKNPNSISIHKAKNDIRNLLLNIKLIEEKGNELRESINELPTNEWEAEISKVNSVRKNISQTLHEYEHHSTLSNLQKLVQIRKRKRLRMKRRKTRLQSDRQFYLEKRKQMHKDIDQWLSNEKEKDLKITRTKEAAEHAEVVLSSVTKKKMDAERYIQLLNCLKELRRARRISAQGNEHGELEFNAKINNLIAVWTDALQEYDLEENTLKLILNDTHKSNEDQWKEVLFGIATKDNEKLMSDTEQNFERFLEIRHAWDSCIVPNDNVSGSYVPTRWVLPPENASDKWKIYRK